MHNFYNTSDIIGAFIPHFFPQMLRCLCYISRFIKCKNGKERSTRNLNEGNETICVMLILGRDAATYCFSNNLSKRIQSFFNTQKKEEERTCSEAVFV